MEKLEICYDAQGDILEVNIGEPSECYFDEVSDDLFGLAMKKPIN